MANWAGEQAFALYFVDPFFFLNNGTTRRLARPMMFV